MITATLIFSLESGGDNDECWCVLHWTWGGDYCSQARALIKATTSSGPAVGHVSWPVSSGGPTLSGFRNGLRAPEMHLSWAGVKQWPFWRWGGWDGGSGGRETYAAGLQESQLFHRKQIDGQNGGGGGGGAKFLLMLFYVHKKHTAY